MATLAELAEHGIVGSADVLPVPPGPERKSRGVLDRARDAVDARMSKDALRHVLQNVIAYAAELEAELYTEQAHGRTLLEQRNAHAQELLRLRPRVAELEAAAKEIQRLHTDSPMGPCPVCIDGDAMVRGDDYTLPYPCPTARLAGAKDCDPPSQREASRPLVEWCTGCNTDHNPDECGYRPGAGDVR
ncbi:hypothetical protein OH715_17065 [Streptomyces cellulosae]|nr:hypothetical protein OH715_17065 [Streptomyces cellulosae]